MHRNDSSTELAGTEKKEDFDVFANNGRIYNLKRTRKTSADAKSEAPFVVDFFGCMDNGVEDQKKVAKFHEELCEETKAEADYHVGLGDFFKEDGVKSPTDPVFDTNYYHIFKKKKVSFQVPGNHDHGFPFLKMGYTVIPILTRGVENDLKKIGHQVKHTYIDRGTGEIDEKKVKIFSQDTLYLDELVEAGIQWAMPGRYYGLRHSNKLKLFIDAATLGKDYIDYFLEENPKKPNQAEWLERVVKENPDVEIEAYLHNSLYSAGKRSYCPDTEDYLGKTQLKKLKENGFLVDKGYGEIERQILQRLKVKPARVIAAHDHSMYDRYEEDKDSKHPFHQIVVGATGGTLQPRHHFDEHTRCFIKGHGFARVCDDQVDYFALPNPDLLEKHGIKGHHIRYKGPGAALKEKADEAGVKELKDITLQACAEYIRLNPPACNWGPIPFRNPDSLTISGAVSKAVDTVPDDLFYADDLRNHFNRFEANLFDTSIRYLEFAFKKATVLMEEFNKQCYLHLVQQQSFAAIEKTLVIFSNLPVFKEDKITQIVEQLKKIQTNVKLNSAYKDFVCLKTHKLEETVKLREEIVALIEQKPVLLDKITEHAENGALLALDYIIQQMPLTDSKKYCDKVISLTQDVNEAVKQTQVQLEIILAIRDRAVKMLEKISELNPKPALTGKPSNPELQPGLLSAWFGSRGKVSPPPEVKTETIKTTKDEKDASPPQAELKHSKSASDMTTPAFFRKSNVSPSIPIPQAPKKVTDEFASDFFSGSPGSFQVVIMSSLEALAQTAEDAEKIEDSGLRL